MKIALTITELHPGGAEKCLVNLACYLHGQGHTVEVWQLWPQPPAGKRSLTEELDRAGIRWYSGNARRPWDFPRMCWRLKKSLGKFQPDVIQSFLFHANLATTWAKPRHAVLFGGARVSQPEPLRQRWQRWYARRMHKLICVSESVARHCESVERIPSSQLAVIPNGIAIEQPSAAQAWSALGIPADSRVILFVGRLCEQKGVVPFSDHWDDLLQALPEHRLVLIGDGPNKQELQSRAGRSEYSERIHIVGHHDNAQAWMPLADCLVLPAIYEGMPNVVLEAMSVGTPVVSFDVDGVREILTTSNHPDAQIASPGDFQGLVNRTIAFASDRALQEQCGAANQTAIRTHFALNDQLEKYAELYAKALSRR